MMANRGELGGKTFISREAWEEMDLNPTDGVLVQKSIKVIIENIKGLLCLRVFMINKLKLQ